MRIAGGHEVEVVYIPEDRPRHALHLLPGRLHADLFLLPYRHAEAGAQPDRRRRSSARSWWRATIWTTWPKPGEGSGERPRLISNIVLMGMGEPLYNFENVQDAMLIAMDGEGISLSRRRITLSTSGVVPEIARTAEEIGCMLAVSLHATTDDVRDEAGADQQEVEHQGRCSTRCAPIRRLSNSERITFEYVMLKGVNDSDEDARRLVKLISGIPAKINLIPFNEWPGAPYERSDWERIEAFADIVYKAGYASPIRTPRGRGHHGRLRSAEIRDGTRAEVAGRDRGRRRNLTPINVRARHLG
jgi:23S rRNA (adenine2503-C2)-methyltransferase